MSCTAGRSVQIRGGIHSETVRICLRGVSTKMLVTRAAIEVPLFFFLNDGAH